MDIKSKGFISTISVWFREGVNVKKFCKDISIRVNDEVRTGLIRPAGKPEVTVTIAGLDFNTPDTLVMEYLNKFGSVTTNSVIYNKFEDGPFKGKYTGERKYKVDFSGAATHMGIYHILDGSKIRVYYRGNKKTCGRCHQASSNCLGGGMAKDCEAAGGERLFLTEHMKTLWDKIGFKPSSFSLEVNEDEQMDALVQDAPIMDAESFPSNFNREEPSERDFKLSDGITIKNIPKSVEDKELFEFLFEKGFPDDHSMELIHINRGGRTTFVVIDAISPDSVKNIYKSLHYPVSKTKFFGASIYCSPLRNTTPVKKQGEVEMNQTEKNSKDTTESPISNLRSIPGLSISAQKKAQKKAKQKGKQAETELGKQKVKLTAKDFLNKSESDIESEFEFRYLNKSDEKAKKCFKSKFFSVSPAHNKLDDELLSDGENDDERGQVKPSAATETMSSGKRVLSPEENLTRVSKLKKDLVSAKR